MAAEVAYDGVPTRLIGSPIKFSGVEQTYDDPPLLSGDARRILATDLGLDEAEIDRLVESGGVRL